MKAYLEEALIRSLEQFDQLQETPDIIFEKPKVQSHGDLSTNLAMTLAKPLKMAPRNIATMIIDQMDMDTKKIEAVEIAGPGFINFRYARPWLYEMLKSMELAGENFGRGFDLSKKRIQIEFVSANPTGPLTVGHGRNAVLGDTLANLYEWRGAEVEREYYFNDGGRQMRMLGLSVAARYDQIKGLDTPLPEGGYEGDYITEIARDIFKSHGDSLDAESSFDVFLNAAKESIFADIQNTLKRMNITMSSFFNELDLYENGAIDSVLERLEKAGYVKKEEGATWFETTKLGKEKDTVLVKSSGEPTYRLPDMAYHINKLERGFDRCVDIFGADHISTYPDVLSAMEILGYEKEKIDVLIYQFVTLIKDGKPFKMSTRKANFVTLDELMDEVGPDVTRFFFLMRQPSTHLEFDIDQAKEASDKNPVFYLQYAHARIKSILRKAEEENLRPDINQVNLLVEEAEINLLKELLNFPDSIFSASEAKEPHRLIGFLNDVASAFHRFYHECRILGIDHSLASARLLLAEVTAAVMKNGLSILGIAAPEKM